MKNKVSIITSCRNAEAYIVETLSSVVDNSAVRKKEIELEYIIRDGASTDATLAIIEKFFSAIRRSNIRVDISSEKDAGLYDGLSKGFRKATGNIVAYINAGDFYSPYAFSIVADIFDQYPIKWLTGLDIVYNNASQIIFSRLPFRYRRNLIQAGFHNNRMLPHVQQESTFWHVDLHDLLDYDVFRAQKYAGDFYLWKSFSEKADLYIIETWLGGFKVHADQLSEDMVAYNKEFFKLRKKPKPADYLQACLDKCLWNMADGFKKKFNHQTIISYNNRSERFELPA